MSPLLLAATLALAADVDPHVIPPGQEALLAAMLGKDLALPGGCRWTGASIDRTTVASHFTCGDREHLLTLCHPSGPCAASAAATTNAFALSGDLPAPLLEVLAQRLREGESTFLWAEGVSATPERDERSSVWPAVGVVAAALGVGVLVASLTRRWLARRP